jgi:hypothetical protein
MSEVQSSEAVNTAVDMGLLNVHLLSGEDIIGHVWLEIDAATGLQSYRVERPVSPSLSMDPQGGVRVGLMPLRPYLPKVVPQVDLLLGHVMWVTPIDGRMKDAYDRFVSDLIIATPSTLNEVLNTK